MTPPPAVDEDPVRRYLREQRQLRTPVVKFAEEHAAGARVQARFRELLPLTAPGAGEQYAFEVDLDSCTGCKSCVAACHSQNGLDDGEWWREVRPVSGGSVETPFAQFVTAACHHCENPGCLEGCPVLAYEKDTVTGIVRHLDDQCIGCQYCVWTCPYEAPKYNERLGIVRKCDMCQQRLAHGEAPACAQACPTDAIRIVKVSRTAGSDAFFPAEPDPVHTVPTTRYVSARPVPDNVRTAAAEAPSPQPAHRPLAAMLLLMQVSVGLVSAACWRPLASAPRTGELGIAAALLGGGLAVGAAHLGQPLRAWRVLLNLKRSWFSREVLAFGLYAAALAGALLESWRRHRAWSASAASPGLLAAGLAAAVLGCAGIGTSVCLYAVTGRSSWTWARVAARFAGTASLGFAMALWLRGGLPPGTAVAVILAKLLVEAELLISASGRRNPSLARTARVLTGPLRTASAARVGLALAAALFVWASIPILALATLAAGEFLERELFFRSVSQPNPASRPTLAA